MKDLLLRAKWVGTEWAGAGAGVTKEVYAIFELTVGKSRVYVRFPECEVKEHLDSPPWPDGPRPEDVRQAREDGLDALALGAALRARERAIAAPSPDVVTEQGK